MSALRWHTVTGSRADNFMVKGTELSVALCGAHSRFQLCEIRAYDAERNADRTYAIRDADTVTDAERKVGKRPSIVAWESDLDAAIAYCERLDPVPVYDDSLEGLE